MDPAFWNEAIKAAPQLVVLLLGFYMVAKLFLGSARRSEELHAQRYETMGQAMVDAQDRSTEAIKSMLDQQKETAEVLGGVREQLRDFRRAV